MSEAKLMERMCPKCRGELTEGFFLGKDGNNIMNALKCGPCNWVWEKP